MEEIERIDLANGLNSPFRKAKKIELQRLQEVSQKSRGYCMSTVYNSPAKNARVTGRNQEEKINPQL